MGPTITRGIILVKAIQEAAQVDPMHLDSPDVASRGGISGILAASDEVALVDRISNLNRYSAGNEMRVETVFAFAMSDDDVIAGNLRGEEIRHEVPDERRLVVPIMYSDDLPIRCGEDRFCIPAVVLQVLSVAAVVR